MKKILLSLLVLMTMFNNNLYSSHYMGGEITWECIPSGQANAGKFIFTLKVYRECNGIQFSTTQTLNSTSPGGNIALTEISGWPKDISPVCNSAVGLTHITCAGATTNNSGAIQEHIYRSQPVLLNGVPPVGGWLFYWGSCCRNPSTNIANATSQGYRLIAKMYPYSNTNTYPCFDNSPYFAEKPNTVICSGYPFLINSEAYDNEQDSLVYEWAHPLGSAGNPINSYYSGYSYNSPFPGTSNNSNNIPASLNSTNGQISFTSYTTGAFVNDVKVTAYKNGVKVAEIIREMQTTILSCGTNSPPTINPPFANGTSYIDTVFAGQTANLIVGANDIGFLSNGNPQTVYLKSTSTQYGSYIPATSNSVATFSTTTGCSNPPCATLTPAPSASNPISGSLGVATSFNWTTNNSHLNGSNNKVYYFTFTTKDDFCPVPGISVKNIKIVVTKPPRLSPPTIKCAEVLNNGNVKLGWAPINDDSLNRFSKYHLFSSNSPSGPFVQIANFTNMYNLSYIDLACNANQNPVYYYMKTSDKYFNELGESSDTISTIFLNANSNPITSHLTWNPINQNVSSGNYIINEQDNASNWNIIDSTNNLYYYSNFSVNNHPQAFQISQKSELGLDSLNVMNYCHSKSNSALYVLSYNIVEEDTVCSTDSLFWRGHWFNSAGMYYDSLVSSLGADSIYTLILNVKNSPNLVSIIQNPSNGVITNTTYGEIFLSLSYNDAKYWTTKGGNMYTSKIHGTGNQLLLGNTFIPGTYEVMSESDNGCERKQGTASFVDTVLSINSINSNTQLKILPNPNKGVFTLEIENLSNKTEEYQLLIYSSTGKRIYDKKLNVQGEINKTINLQPLSKGVYFIRLKNKDGIVVRRFVVK